MNLEEKFEALETQLATQNTAIINALDSILTALGAPPPTATVTLGDTLAMMVALNNNLIGMAIADGSFHTALLSAIGTLNNTTADILSVVEQININTDTIITNNSLNAQRILTLMLQTACPCDITDPLLPLPVDTTPTELENDARCQRIQYFLDLFGSWAITTGVYLDNHGSISSFQVKNLLDIALLDVGITDSELNNMSISTRDNLTILLNTSGSTSSINTAIFNAINDTDFMAAMRQALFDADNASAGKSAADDVISANISTHANIIAAMFYASWLNVMYSTTPEVDASAYDGDVCAPDEPELMMAIPITGCHSAQSIDAIMGDGSHLQIIEWTNGTNSNYVDAGTTQTSDHDVWGLDDLYGLWASSVPTCHAFLDATGYPNIYIGATPQQITVHTNNRYAFLTPSTPFILTLCVDEPS
jgi:hypothetical protein